MKLLNKFSLSKDAFCFVIWTAGILGAIAGLSTASWHDAVESAQVLAGIVRYPEPTPFFIYHIKTWTLLNQIPALFLNWGVSEIHLSHFLSALIGALAYQCLAGAFFTFSGDKWLAILFPFLVDSAKMFSSAPNYPVILMGVSASYGIFGLMYCFLTMILLSHGRNMSGGIMLGLALAVHPPLAVLTWLITGIASISQFRQTAKNIGPFFITGLALSAISLFFYRHAIAPYPATEIFSAQELGHFIRNWDSHRHAISPIHLPTLTILFLEFLVLKLPKEQTTQPLKKLTALLFISGTLALFAAFLWNIPQEKLPFFLIQLMPTRIVNFNILAAACLICGLLCRQKSPLSQLSLLSSTLILFFVGRRFPEHMDTALIGTCLTACLLLLFFPNTATKKDSLFSRPLTGLVFLMLSLFAFTNPPQIDPRRSHSESVFKDWSNDSLFRKIRDSKGILLLDPNLGTIQLRTRRPVLLDPGSLDTVSYLPELGPATVLIFKKIYGIDLFSPSEDFDEFLNLETGSNLRLWETRDTSAWREIKNEFGVTQILTTGGKLQLPEAARNEKYVLYDIP